MKRQNAIIWTRDRSE